jgi:CubicO group peptidase (beta-lactamase class C family)
MRLKNAKLGILWIVVGLFLSGCTGDSSPAVVQEPVVGESALGWPMTSPEALGMDSARLAAMLETIADQGYAIDGLVVVRNGFLVLEAAVHPNRFTPDYQHNVYSCTKSVIGALIGIAIEEGYIEGVDVPVLDFFPDRQVANLDARKEVLTLEHLLTMTSGLDCRDSYLHRWVGLEAMRGSEDWSQYVLDLPMVADPGSRFEYCNGASQLLSAILQETTGMTAAEFAEAHLFDPLGITTHSWPANNQGVTLGYANLALHPENMAKIGQLYLNSGEWNGEQIVPEHWVQASTRKYIAATLQDGYGYQWWIEESGIYMALGYAGQFIFVVPDEELVVAFVSDLPEQAFYTPQQLLHAHVLPAIKSDGSIPENPAALERLQAQIAALAEPK